MFKPEKCIDLSLNSNEQQMMQLGGGSCDSWTTVTPKQAAVLYESTTKSTHCYI